MAILILWKLDFITFHFVFLISVLFPTFPPSFLAFPPRFPAFLPYSPHSHPDSTYSHPYSPQSHPIPNIPRILTQIPRIPTPIPCIPTFIPCIPLILFPDSPFRLLQIARFINVLYYKLNITLVTSFINRLCFYRNKLLKSSKLFCTDFTSHLENTASTLKLLRTFQSNESMTNARLQPHLQGLQLGISYRCS